MCTFTSLASVISYFNREIRFSTALSLQRHPAIQKYGDWKQHTFSEKQDVFQFGESKGLLTYAQTRVSYVLNTACELETFYITLWEGKNEVSLVYWQTWRLRLSIFLFTDHICNMTCKFSLEAAKRTPGWFLMTEANFFQHRTCAWDVEAFWLLQTLRKWRIHHQMGSGVLCGQLIFTETRRLQCSSQ